MNDRELYKSVHWEIALCIYFTQYVGMICVDVYTSQQ